MEIAGNWEKLLWYEGDSAGVKENLIRGTPDFVNDSSMFSPAPRLVPVL